MKTFLCILAVLFCFFSVTAYSQTIVNSFSTGGNFAGGLEYDAATDTIWVVDSNADTVFQFDRAGNQLTSWAAPRSLAIGVGVDPNTGNLWVGDESEYVDEVTPAGVLTGRSWPTTPTITDVSGIAVDPVTGNIFISQDSGVRTIAEFDPNGVLIRTIDLTAAGSTDPDGLGYNPATMTFFLGEDTANSVIEVDINGNFLNLWDLNSLGVSPEGVGIDAPNGMVFIAGGFDNMVYEIDGMITSTQALTVDVSTISETTGGIANFTLNAGNANAGRSYLIFSGVTGTSPGIFLPPSMVNLPINWDAFTTLALSLTNTPIFFDFYGILNGSGQGTAVFNTLGPFSGGAGLTLYFAFGVEVGNWDFASNAVSIDIVP